MVDCPGGGIHGYPAPPVSKEEIQHSFFVPKLCNLCRHSPCVQVCPVGATYQASANIILTTWAGDGDGAADIANHSSSIAACAS